MKCDSITHAQSLKCMKWQSAGLNLGVYNNNTFIYVFIYKYQIGF